MQEGREPTPWMEDYSDQCAWLPGSIAWALLKVLLVTVAAAILCWACLYLGGCQASGEGRGGASAFEHRREAASTERIVIEKYGDGPIDPAILLALPRGTIVEKKR